MLNRGICALAALALLVAPAAAGNFSWVFQETGMGTPTSEVALAMRGGNVWPVIFNVDEAVTLLPTGWALVGSMSFPDAPAAVSSPTGEVAAWSTDPSPDDFGVVSSATGWSGMTADAMAFDAPGR